MKRQMTAYLSLLACLWMTACGSRSNAPGAILGEVYVIVPAEKSSLFTTYLASVVRKYGMIPNLGQATDDKGYSIYVLDATSPSVRLRSENVPLSGHEDSEQCGVYNEPHSDPRQYSITVSSGTQMVDSHDSRDLLAKIVKDLKADGYAVQQQSIKCSKQSKIESKD